MVSTPSGIKPYDWTDNLTPIPVRIAHDNVLVKWKEVDKVTQGGIVLPSENSAERPLQGTVCAIGPKVSDDFVQPLSELPGSGGLRIGDEIMFERFAGTPVKLAEEYFMLMSEQDIVMVLVKES
jgi:chaperonin GroES